MPYRTPASMTLIGLLLSGGTAVEAGDGRRSPESDIAAPGSPLYEYAVTESVRSLMSKQDQAELGVAGRPPSPGPDYYWCENCRTYHKRQASPGAGPAAAGRPGALPGAANASSPAGPGPDTYWCEQCKTYHLRQTPGQPGGAASNAVPAARAGASPTANGDYYYCEECKTYHRRQPAAQASPLGLGPVFGGTPTNLNERPLNGPQDGGH